MDDQFDLPVEYKGSHYHFKTTLVVYGFSHRFNVDVHGQSILFEPDEEKNYRAILPYDDITNNKNIDINLLKKISEEIAGLVK